MLKDARITSEDEYNKLKDLIKLKTKITSFNTDNILDYEEQLKNVFKFTYLNKKKENLKYLLSYQSMSLYADYKNRLEVLRMLNYVDNKYSGIGCTFKSETKYSTNEAIYDDTICFHFLSTNERQCCV